MTWKPNTGYKPSLLTDSRVDVRLRNGREAMGWPIDGKGACNFALRDFEFDIMFWRKHG